jgi:Zn-dependent peptidase ImmA (M78 family)
MTSLLEEKHIRVFFIEAPDSFDACTFWADGRPCIVARKNLPGDRLRFNLAHELGHLVIQTPDEGDKRTREKPTMHFASAFLVPSPVVKRELGETRKKLGLRELHILKMKYGLSISAWVFRAKDLGIIAESCAKGLFMYLKKNFGKREPWADEFPPESPPTRMKQLVLRALAESVISESKAAELLGQSLYQFRQEFEQP